MSDNRSCPGVALAATAWLAVPASTVLVERLDLLTVIFHRRSGITHLLAEPAPEILAALADQPLTTAALLDRLSRDFDVADAGSLAERLAELEAAGLVEKVA